jgi:hypothetical protein
MVYTRNTQDYWVFGLRPSSGILENTKEHNVSETGSGRLKMVSQHEIFHFILCIVFRVLVLSARFVS